uniref:GOLD domain-containing protein n=1 Tax=Otus sunia TaxID=257818 RepID=A0A8C8AH19_9STRI
MPASPCPSLSIPARIPLPASPCPSLPIPPTPLCSPRSVEPTEAGDYKLCFDNSFSTISEKLVFFELIFDSAQEDDEEEEEEEGDAWVEAAEPEDTLDVKIEDIKVGMRFDGGGGGVRTPL